MTTELNQQDRAFLEQLARRKGKPTKRQKAVALLDFVQGEPLEKIAVHAGIATDDLAVLFDLYHERGLDGLGLVPPSRRVKDRSERHRFGTIVSTPGVCGGSARVSGTRIPVWVLVEARDLGVSEAQLLLDYPELRAVNLVDAWDYASDHGDEIAAEIHRNNVA